jgi:Mg2+/Co2+ transporter CorB
MFTGRTMPVTTCLQVYSDMVYVQRDLESLIDFDNAIKDTITAINAGSLFDRETREILSRAKGKSYITNPKWRQDLEDIIGMLRAIRKTFQRQMSKEDPGQLEPAWISEMEENRLKAMGKFAEICAEAGISPPHYYQ